MDESRLELKVGALVASSIVALLVLLWLMGEFRFTSGRELVVDFAHTGNVVRGAPVKLGGVAVGKVEKVELLATRRDASNEPLPVKMTLTLTAEADESLRNDASITISSQGPLGEPYLELWPGAGKDPRGKAPIRGVDSPRIDLVSNRLAHFLESASAVLEKDPETLSKLFTGVNGLTNTVDGMLTENRADVRQIAQELTQAAKDLRALSATARAQLEPGGKATAMIDDAAAAAKIAKTDLPELSKKASIAIGGLANVSGQLTEEDGQRIKAMLVKYQAAGEKLDGIAVKADRLMTRLEAGDGTLGAFLKDKQAYDDLKSLLADLRKHPWKMLWKE